VGHLLGLLFVLGAVIQVSPATAVWSNPICRLISPQLASRLIPIAIFNGLTADAADPQVAEAPAAEKTYMALRRGLCKAVFKAIQRVVCIIWNLEVCRNARGLQTSYWYGAKPTLKCKYDTYIAFRHTQSCAARCAQHVLLTAVGFS
jgi:hypothetical protein